jgi:hypothetical protein
MSNLYNIQNYYSLRFGEIKVESQGDFIDNIESSLNLITAKLTNEDDDEYLVVFNKSFGHLFFKNQNLYDVVIEVVEKLKSNIIFPDGLLAGLICSTEDQDPDGIIDHCPDYENSFFEADECDDVEDFAESFFGIGSITYESDATFDIESNVVYEGEDLDDLSDLYGRFDEDQSWVIGVKK